MPFQRMRWRSPIEITSERWLDKILGENWTQSLLRNPTMKASKTKAAKRWGREGNEDNGIPKVNSTLLASCLEVQLNSISKRASGDFAWKLFCLHHRSKSLLRNVHPRQTPVMLIIVRHFRITHHLSEFLVVWFFNISYLCQSIWIIWQKREVEIAWPKLCSDVNILLAALQRILQNIQSLKHIGNWGEKALWPVGWWPLLTHSTKLCSLTTHGWRFLLIFMKDVAIVSCTFRIHPLLFSSEET